MLQRLRPQSTSAQLRQPLAARAATHRRLPLHLARAEMKRFEGKVAVVTGASDGMGEGAALRLAEEGAKVVLAARRQEKLDKAAEDIKKATGAEALTVVTDATDPKAVEALFDKAIEAFGKVDVAFLNVGGGPGKPTMEVDEETYTASMDMNLKTVVFGLKFAMLAIKKNEGGGAILVNSSAMSHAAKPDFVGMQLYSAAKAGADMLVKYAAIEGAEHKIRVNAICPGVVATSIMGKSMEESDEFGGPMQLVGRAGRVPEIASHVAYLLSDEASFVTASVQVADGGWLVKA